MNSKKTQKEAIVDSVLLLPRYFPGYSDETHKNNYPRQYTYRNSNRAPTKKFRDFKMGPEVMRAMKYAEGLVIPRKKRCYGHD